MTGGSATTSERANSALLYGARLLLALGVLAVALGLAIGLAGSPTGLVPYAWPVVGAGAAALTAGLPLAAFAVLEARLLRAERALRDCRAALEAARQALETARGDAEAARDASTFRSRPKRGADLMNPPIDGRARNRPARPLMRR